MGVGLCNYMENNILDWMFKQTPFPAQPTALGYSLHSADPGDAGASELAHSAGYERAPLAPDVDNSHNSQYNAKATGSPATAQKITNLLDITFPPASGDWNSASAILFYTCWTSITYGAGSALFTGAIGGSGVVVLNGNTLKLIGSGAGGAMSFQLD